MPYRIRHKTANCPPPDYNIGDKKGHPIAVALAAAPLPASLEPLVVLAADLFEYWQGPSLGQLAAPVGHSLEHWLLALPGRLPELAPLAE
jgi:hypothetical protein